MIVSSLALLLSGWCFSYTILDFLPWPWNRKKLVIHCNSSTSGKKRANNLPSWLGINLLRVFVAHPWKVLGMSFGRGIQLQQKEIANDEALEVDAVAVEVDRKTMQELLHITRSRDSFSIL
jgi:hypothetical protein